MSNVREWAGCPSPLAWRGGMSERDIIERLMDFERCGITAEDRVEMRESAAMEIFNLRQRVEALRSALKVIEGSTDRLRALQAAAALNNIGPDV